MASLLAALSGTVTQLLSPAALERIPQHVAVIMDGSSRWARSRNVPRLLVVITPLALSDDRTLFCFVAAVQDTLKSENCAASLPDSRDEKRPDA